MSAAYCSGALAADGRSPADAAAFGKTVFYMPGDGALLHRELGVLRHLRLAKALWGSPHDPRDVAVRCGLGKVLQRPAVYLSKGMRQQLSLAIAYMTDARYVLLDEPANALDPSRVATLSRVVRRMAERERGVLVSSHLLDELGDLCDSVLLMVDDTLREAPCDGDDLAELFRATYGGGPGRDVA